MAPPPIVIIDDDVDHAVIARTVLSMLAPNADVDVITDMRVVAERLKVLPPRTLVLIDRLLDTVESYPLIAELTTNRTDVRVVMLSAAMSPEDARRARDAGAMVAAAKPGGLVAWKSLLSGVLERIAREDPPSAGRSSGGAVA